MDIKSVDKFRRRYRLLIIAGIAGLCVLCLEFSQVNKISILYGGIVIAVGMLIRLWTNGTIVKSKTVCNTGPYSICRHPMYFGTTVASIGVAILLYQPYFAALILIAVAISFERAKAEEKKLIDRFPEYLNFKKQVPALPTPTSLYKAITSGAIASGFSMKLMYENGEVTRINLYYLITLASLTYLKFRGIFVLSTLYYHLLFLSLLIMSALSFLLFPAETRYKRSFFVLCMLAACIGSLVMQF